MLSRERKKKAWWEKLICSSGLSTLVGRDGHGQFNVPMTAMTG